ncbi:glycosyltransferase family 4 protein [Acidithiobacillus ferrivorans]|uniref:Glycosyltransferase family 4 protein n=1 Tax=Acidithiobacillus ferrivorans TaxID=160808 RepID=A0A7T5BGQ1_9PROT|nr:glycosyltransferase family 4 protein [Acidithiobacillus ferrivorans]QQD71798.1 glycosyltransferase family 4 protein [Acidithiobacillus ferrivorans]
MKILFCSHAFHPNLGGLESVGLLLAREFASAGQEVVVVTQTPTDEDDLDFPFKVVRHPHAKSLLRLTAWADVVYHHNISLQTAWPLMLVRRPWVVSHHGWLPRGSNQLGVKGMLKRLVLRSATGIAVSQAVAMDYKTTSTVIPNPYDDRQFRIIPGIVRDQDLVFVGRLVSDKGLPVLLHALRHLASCNLRPNLTVIGGGPEDKAWRQLALDLGLAGQVRFVGPKRGDDLAVLLNSHRVLVVPSLWNEPFGVVALEGLACGCVVIGSEGGGLKEAIGAAGLTFPNGDAPALAQCLKKVLSDPEIVVDCLSAAPEHLNLHRPSRVAQRYLAILSESIQVL